MTEGISVVPGVEVGHWTNEAAATGCTVVLCPEGAVAAADVRGGAPGTRETDALRPGNLASQVHAIVLSGGSAYGLAAADGVMRYLEKAGIGFRVRGAVVPVVPAAILFDLGLVTDRVRPGAGEGYHACVNASSGEVQEGSVGAGTGATVGKALGMERCVKGGVGTAAVELGEGLVVAALVAVNCYGGVVDHRTGQIVAGPRQVDGGFHDTVELLIRGEARLLPGEQSNTTIGVVATDAALSREQVARLARSAHDGLALVIRPCHTLVDGDTIFSLATGKCKGDVDALPLSAAASEATAQAVLRAVRSATSLGGVPSVGELSRG